MDFDQVIDSALGCLGPPEVVPDAILPAQFFPRAAQSNTGTGTRRAKRHRAEVEAWFTSDSDVWHFSFVNICHALALDAATVRSRLGWWRQGAQPRVVRLPIPAGDEAARLARTG